MEWKNVLTCLLHVCNTIKIYQKNFILSSSQVIFERFHDMSSLLGKILLSEALISSLTNVSRFSTLAQVVFVVQQSLVKSLTYKCFSENNFGVRDFL